MSVIYPENPGSGGSRIKPTLTDFLLDRIAEDEEVARTATASPWEHDPSKEWHTDPAMLTRARADKLTYGGEEFVRTDSGTCVAATGPADDAQSMADADHIARHDPARVLAECEAKRRIVEVVSGWTHLTVEDCWYSCAATYGTDVEDACCDDGREGMGCDCGLDRRVQLILGPLATVYADHPDYREEWRP